MKKESLKRLGEGENMETIEKVYEAIKSDRAIMSLIERIKSHEWVRVVEGGN